MPYKGPQLEASNHRNWLEHNARRYYMPLRTAFAFLAFVLALGCFVGALALSYLYLGAVPRMAALLVILAGFLAAVGIRLAIVVFIHTAGRRWISLIALIFNSAMVLAVIVMYAVGFFI